MNGQNTQFNNKTTNPMCLLITYELRNFSIASLITLFFLFVRCEGKIFVMVALPPPPSPPSFHFQLISPPGLAATIGPASLLHFSTTFSSRDCHNQQSQSLCTLRLKTLTQNQSNVFIFQIILIYSIYTLKGFWLPFWIGRCWCKFAESGDWRWLSVMRDQNQQLSDQWSVTSQSARPYPSFEILSTLLFHSTSKHHPKKVSGTFCFHIQLFTIQKKLCL